MHIKYLSTLARSLAIITHHNSLSLDVPQTRTAFNPTKMNDNIDSVPNAAATALNSTKMNNNTDSVLNIPASGSATDSHNDGNNLRHVALNCNPQPFFTPFVFRIRDGIEQFSILPIQQLVQGVPQEALTVQHLSLIKFWKCVQSRSGSTPKAHRLLLITLDKCKQ